MVRSGALLALVLACLLTAGAHAAISCGQVVSYLMPCLGYARAIGPLTAGCCSGVRALDGAARTTPDRQTTCNCLKRSTAGIEGLQPGLISGIPRKCGVNIPFSISPSTDCSRQVSETALISSSQKISLNRASQRSAVTGSSGFRQKQFRGLR
ncbi:hypothetical protein C4D60_Mb07t05390 [Musa balbisiana]|uniref:Non-specific lipid-transfer protein n=1 Tax=Musa balbisiana TaxID=52838 RepID=A0A4S8JD42_MUSBA|nr:hypothetical protein C4D60_Mb07t05390 [Musa balbisiana]